MRASETKPALRVRCPAKINLGLWILGRRPDGYHEIDTILQTVMLEDELILELAGEPAGPGLKLQVQGRPVPGPGPNLVERAWALLAEEGLLRPGKGVRARLVKRLPVGAGLGGGSSDAAGFLAGVNRLLSLGLSAEALRSLGARLGSDVPFFFRGGTARGTGRGDRVRHLCPIAPLWIVLATPPVAVSTTWAYAHVRNRLTADGGGASMLESAIARGDLDGITSAMRNDFEDVVLPRFAVVAETKRALRAGGAVSAQLSGSGSTLFGVASSREEALAVARAIASSCAEIRVARTLERGVTVARHL